MLTILFLMSLVGTAPALLNPAVGAIRWDAWYGGTDSTGAYVEEALSPSEWRYRLPFFAKELNSTSVSTNGSTISVMRQELSYAHDYNISYWAFVAYPPTTNLFYAQRNYLAVMDQGWNTPSVPAVKFCLILDGNGLSMLAKGTAYFLEYFKKPFYQTTLQPVEGIANRPLVFIFGANATARGPGSAAAGIGALTAACSAQGIPKPYVVSMSFGSAAQQAKEREALGADAVSTYASVDFSYFTPAYQGVGLPYALNAAQELGNANAAAAAGLDLVPTVTAGWDPRPREVRSPPWQHQQSKPGCNVSGVARCWVQDPTMEELRNHTRDVVAFARKHSNGVASSGVVLVSAWNEHDEGHWICPSLRKEPTQTTKLEAIRDGVASGTQRTVTTVATSL